MTEGLTDIIFRKLIESFITEPKIIHVRHPGELCDEGSSIFRPCKDSSSFKKRRLFKLARNDNRGRFLEVAYKQYNSLH